MKIPRRYIRVATVLTIAAATGHIMQNGDAIAARLGVGGEDQIAAALAQTGSQIGPQAGPQTEVDALATPSEEVTRGLGSVPGLGELLPDHRMPVHLTAPGQHQVAGLETVSDVAPIGPEAVPGVEPEQPMAAKDCAPELVAEPLAAAMVRLSLTAPCNANAEVRVSHGGIAFKTHTDADGAFSLEVPVLQSPAQFSVAVAGAEEILTQIEMPTLEGYDRVAVTWAGSAALELHAFEFGAEYGQPGHVWSGNPKSADVAIGGRGGFSTLLGDADGLAPVRAEVYTFPAGHAARIGLVALSLEAEVTAASCGQEIAGHTVRVVRGETPKGVDVTLSVPECDAIGDFLVLNNLFDDLKIAAK